MFSFRHRGSKSGSPEPSYENPAESTSRRWFSFRNAGLAPPPSAKKSKHKRHRHKRSAEPGAESEREYPTMRMKTVRSTNQLQEVSESQLNVRKGEATMRKQLDATDTKPEFLESLQWEDSAKEKSVKEKPTKENPKESPVKEGLQDKSGKGDSGRWKSFWGSLRLSKSTKDREPLSPGVNRDEVLPPADMCDPAPEFTFASLNLNKTISTSPSTQPILVNELEKKLGAGSTVGTQIERIEARRRLPVTTLWHVWNQTKTGKHRTWKVVQKVSLREDYDYLLENCTKFLTYVEAEGSFLEIFRHQYFPHRGEKFSGGGKLRAFLPLNRMPAMWKETLDRLMHEKLLSAHLGEDVYGVSFCKAFGKPPTAQEEGEGTLGQHYAVTFWVARRLTRSRADNVCKEITRRYPLALRQFLREMEYEDCVIPRKQRDPEPKEEKIVCVPN